METTSQFRNVFLKLRSVSSKSQYVNIHSKMNLKSIDCMDIYKNISICHRCLAFISCAYFFFVATEVDRATIHPAPTRSWRAMGVASRSLDSTNPRSEKSSNSFISKPNPNSSFSTWFLDDKFTVIFLKSVTKRRLAHFILVAKYSYDRLSRQSPIH